MSIEHIIDKTKRLIAIPSTQNDPTALGQAVDFVADFVCELNPGVTIEHFVSNDRPSFLAYRGARRPDEFDILLNGHVDVVPAKPGQFSPRIDNGRLYGRGALDMKGTALSLAAVFCEVSDKVPYKLGLQIVSDEEIGGYDGVKFQIDAGVRANFVVMGEYSNTRHTIYNAARGLCWAEIAFKGKSAHGGHLWHGSNAVLKAGEFAGAVLKHYPTPDKETWGTTASIANLSTPNDTYNKVPDTAVLKIDFRFTQNDPVFQNRESLKAFIASIDPDARLVNTPVFEPAVFVDELNPYVQGLSAAMRKVGSPKVRYRGRPAASDGRHFALIGSDVIEFGLYGKYSHSDQEYAEISSFHEYYDVMRTFLLNPVPEKLRTSAVKAPLHQQLLKDLVAMPTVTSDKQANKSAVSYIGKFLEERGMYVDRYESDGYASLVASTRREHKRPIVMLSAHTDVVPSADGDYSLAIKDGKYRGRGVMDMKFAIASYLWLADKLQDEIQSYDFGIMITSDEEVGGSNGTGMLVQQMGYHPLVAIVPDSGENWQLETFAKGVQWIRLEANGKSAHASRPWEGESAISRLLQALHEIERLAPSSPRPEDTIISIGTIEGGTTANQIPQAASAVLDIRFGSMDDYDMIYSKIRKICKAHGVQDQLVVNDPPCINNPKNQYIKPFINIVTQHTGEKHKTSYSYAATDGRYFGAVGTPCIIIQPPSGGHHTEHEWLSARGFDQFCTILEQYMRQVALRPAESRRAGTLLAGGLSERPEYVWYATYGSGLSKENFMCYVEGGRPEGISHRFPGCTDKSGPRDDVFMSIPFELYFAGESKIWGGGYAHIKSKPSTTAHTIARAYLVTLDQFRDIVAQHNEWQTAPELPAEDAARLGHATIGSGDGAYDELVYCGMREGHPIFTITATKPLKPYVPPTATYTNLLYKGLSEFAKTTEQAAVNYILTTSDTAGKAQEQTLLQLFRDAAKRAVAADHQMKGRLKR